MATLNVSVTQSNVLLTTAVSSGSTLDFVIDNPIPYTSYFTLETVADNNGFYTNSTSKNTSGSFTLGTGQFGLIQSDYMASVVVPSGSTTLSFIPAVNIPASTLYLRGIGAGPYSTITSFTGLLDTYPVAAFAFSVRLLSSTYAGSAIRVRRSSDNTEQNIGFDSSGNLDTASLLSFCGAGNGFVTTWYDQSGNGRNATQTTATKQPQIVGGGSLITMNGFASLQSTQNQAKFDASRGGTYSGNELSIFNAVDYQGANTWYVTADGSINLPDGVLSWGYSNQYGQYRSGIDIGNSIVSGQNFLGINIWNNLAQMKSYVNNSSAYNGGIVSGFDYTMLNIMNQQAVEDSFKMQECIIYEADKTSDKSAIQTNINDYYGIY